jgi:hypothetical protein
MRTPARIVRAHQNLWKPPGYELWKTTAVSVPYGRMIADAARELEIGTELLRKSGTKTRTTAVSGMTS